MPFQSKAQARAAFGGFLGPEMKAKAKKWADETPNMKKLPNHKGPMMRQPGRGMPMEEPMMPPIMAQPTTKGKR